MGNYLNPGNDMFYKMVHSEIYVDKTGLIGYCNHVINTMQRYICVSRPRRFGKSMAANMLSAYYSRECDSEKLFEGLEISKESGFKKHLNQYDTIFLNMQEFLSRTGDVDKLIDRIKKLVIRELKAEHPDVDYFDDTDLVESMQDIYREKKIPFVVIIDEWDCIFREYKQDKEAQEKYLDFLRDLLKDKGYIVCAATGRPLNQLKLILQRVQFDYYVLINGSYILDKDFQEIGSYPILQDNVNDLVNFSKKYETGLMFHFGDATYIYNNFYPMYDFCKYCNVLDSLFYDPSQSYHLRHKAFNAVVLTKDKKLVDQFMEAHPNLRNDLINVKTNGFCFDIFNADNDKSKGIEMILEKTGLTWKDAICFGDSTNDIHMLKKADIGVAMGNASDFVKSYANFATTSTYDNGIYNAVTKILKDE